VCCHRLQNDVGRGRCAGEHLFNLATSRKIGRKNGYENRVPVFSHKRCPNLRKCGERKKSAKYNVSCSRYAWADDHNKELGLWPVFNVTFKTDKICVVNFHQSTSTFYALEHLHLWVSETMPCIKFLHCCRPWVSCEHSATDLDLPNQSFYVVCPSVPWPSTVPYSVNMSLHRLLPRTICPKYVILSFCSVVSRRYFGLIPCSTNSLVWCFVQLTLSERRQLICSHLESKPIILFLSSALSVHASASYKATGHTKDVNNLSQWRRKQFASGGGGHNAGAKRQPKIFWCAPPHFSLVPLHEGAQRLFVTDWETIEVSPSVS